MTTPYVLPLEKTTTITTTNNINNNINKYTRKIHKQIKKTNKNNIVKDRKKSTKWSDNANMEMKPNRLHKAFAFLFLQSTIESWNTGIVN